MCRVTENIPFGFPLNPTEDDLRHLSCFILPTGSPLLPRKSTWQTEAGNVTETTTEPGKSDDSEAQIPDLQRHVWASSGTAPTAERMLGQHAAR